jgi:hypothetical protein
MMPCGQSSSGQFSYLCLHFRPRHSGCPFLTPNHKGAELGCSTSYPSAIQVLHQDTQNMIATSAKSILKSVKDAARPEGQAIPPLIEPSCSIVRIVHFKPRNQLTSVYTRCSCCHRHCAAINEPANDHYHPQQLMHVPLPQRHHSKNLTMTTASPFQCFVVQTSFPEGSCEGRL